MRIRTDYLAFGRPDFTDAEIDAVGRVLRSGWVGMGPETEAFEKELAQAVGAPHVVAVSSCTSALTLALLANGIGRGDEVICPSLTWCSTANAALYIGARPVFCEVDPRTFCVSPESVLAVVTPRTKAVIPVHFGGLAVDVFGLRKALPDPVKIIEDAAHALGGCFPDGTPVGSSGNATCFSFYANKNVSTADGGAVALIDDDQADHIRSLRQHALPVNAWKRFTHAEVVLLSPQLEELGYKANYTDLQAAIGRIQLKRLAAMSSRRRKIAGIYMDLLCELEGAVVPQHGMDSPGHALHLFAVRIAPDARMSRDSLLLELRKRNIGATIHYALLHPMPLYRHPGQSDSLPVTEALGREILTLPISANMRTEDAEYVCDHLRTLLS